MSNYIKTSLDEISKSLKDNLHTIIRIETTSGSEAPRIINVIAVGEDFIIGHGRKSIIPEKFSFNHITNWRFAEFNEADWSRVIK